MKVEKPYALTDVSEAFTKIHHPFEIANQEKKCLTLDKVCW